MTTNNDARAYELMLVLNATKSDDAINKHAASIKKHIEELGGEVFFEDVWGRRELAYTIKKEDVGYYIVWNFHIDGEKITELLETLRIDQMILRNLLTKTPAGYEPTPITDEDLEWSKGRREEIEQEAKEEEAKPVKKEKKPAKKEVVEEKEEVVEEETVEEVAEEPTEEVKEEEVAEETTEEVAEEAQEEEAEEAVEEVAEEEAPAEEKEEKKEEKPKKEKKETTMDDLDEKLKAIMNDTDIDISL